MLTRVDLEHFKCFELLRLPLAQLTVLTGTNASGKSSVLQALTLLNQTMREHEWSSRLMLNGEALRLGTVADVVDKVHGRRTVAVSLHDESGSYAWRFEGERSEMSMEVAELAIDGTGVARAAGLRYLFPPDCAQHVAALAGRLRRLTYLSAERIGPRDVYPIEDQRTATVVGSMGEYAASVLHWGRDEQALEGLALANIPATRLRQVEGRMRQFFPGCGLVLQQIPQANAVTLGFRTSDATDFHRPAHVGFGLTQAFPIVVAALAAEEGDILLIENPEVHLHPAGQAQMGRFLADLARAGIQVIAETHSDHVLNGIRRATRMGVIEADRVAIHFFRQSDGSTPQVVSPQLHNDGNIDVWPSGFFDQFERDTSFLVGWDE